ncbi:MAG TPA: hypothetical protein VH370_24190 [Humisphaera sp.]|jgi:hypothetical protein|nr:hypothetical protein [Humisphaera sp.]
MATVTPADIFSRIIDPGNPTLTPEAAQALLRFGFSEADQARIADLARKSNEGSLTPDERDELESYVLVGDIFSLMKSKARLSLHRRTPAA